MATKIIHKKSSVASSAPVAADIAPGELALNLADKKIYSKQTDGTIIEMGGTKPLAEVTDVEDYVSGTTPSDGDILQWNTNDSEWKVVSPSSGTINEDLTNWTLDSGSTWDISEVSNSLYFAFGGSNRMKIDSNGAMQVTGDVEANATISGASTTSLYFSLSGTKYVELSSTGNLLVSSDIESNATIT